MTPTALVEKGALLKVELRRQDVEESIATFKKRRQQQEDAAKLVKDNKPSQVKSNATAAVVKASSSAATSPRAQMRRISLSEGEDDYEDRSSLGSGDGAPSSATSDPAPAQNPGAKRKTASGPIKNGAVPGGHSVEGTDPVVRKANLSETRNGTAEIEDTFDKDAMAAYHSRNNLAPAFVTRLRVLGAT